MKKTKTKTYTYKYKYDKSNITIDTKIRKAFDEFRKKEDWNEFIDKVTHFLKKYEREFQNFKVEE